MRNPERLDSFYDEMKEIHKKYFPDWRFGQLMANFIRQTGDPFYLEEDRFMKSFKEFVQKMTGEDV